jgi:hypothetical protein
VWSAERRVGGRPFQDVYGPVHGEGNKLSATDHASRIHFLLSTQGNGQQGHSTWGIVGHGKKFGLSPVGDQDLLGESVLVCSLERGSTSVALFKIIQSGCCAKN